MFKTVLVDGQETDAEWVSERAFQFGDGLFETLAVRDGRPCLWQAHMARLLEGCDRLRLPRPDISLLDNYVRHASRDLTVGAIKLYWTAGRSPRGYGRPDPINTSCVVVSAEAALPPDQVNLRVCDTRLGSSPALAGIKHLNRLEQVLARNEWRDPTIYEGLMLDGVEHVVEGTMSNLLLQKGGCLYTPELSQAGVSGVVRNLVIKTAAAQDEALQECHLSLTDCLQADALYLTNSLIGILRVDRLVEHVYADDVVEPRWLCDARSKCFEG